MEHFGPKDTETDEGGGGGTDTMMKGISPLTLGGFSVVYTNKPGGEKLNTFSI